MHPKLCSLPPLYHAFCLRIALHLVNVYTSYQFRVQSKTKDPRIWIITQDVFINAYHWFEITKNIFE